MKKVGSIARERGSGEQKTTNANTTKSEGSKNHIEEARSMPAGEQTHCSTQSSLLHSAQREEQSGAGSRERGAEQGIREQKSDCDSLEAVRTSITQRPRPSYHRVDRWQHCSAGLCSSRRRRPRWSVRLTWLTAGGGGEGEGRSSPVGRSQMDSARQASSPPLHPPTRRGGLHHSTRFRRPLLRHLIHRQRSCKGGHGLASSVPAPGTAGCGTLHCSSVRQEWDSRVNTIGVD